MLFNFFLDREPPANASSSLPFDLTTPTSALRNACDARNSADIEATSSGSGRLPDFLSDSHVLAHNDSRSRDVRATASENNIELEPHTERPNLISAVRIINTLIIGINCFSYHY